MMHSRGFVLSENQAFAGQTRTPGPSRLHASPTRKNMTTGKRALGQSSKLFGQEPNSAGPKQLFKDLGSTHSPVKALGDRNASKTPGLSKLAPGKQDASPQKGKGASGNSMDSSPTKKGSSELSPRKASTSNALRSLNGKQRQTTELPFTKPTQNDASASAFKTPAPTQLGKARPMSRQNSFVTPAANIGRAGQIKARMGEIMDAEMGLSLQKGDNATEQVTEQPAVQMTEEEMYPEIEYMPPSFKHPVFEFPDELDDLPRAKEVGAQLSRFTTLGIRAGQPDDLSDVEVSPIEMSTDVDLAPPTPALESDDDDPWPNVLVTEEEDTMQQSAVSRPKAAVSKVVPNAATRPTTTTARPLGAATGRAATVSAGARTATAQRAINSTSIKPRTVPSAAGTRAVPGKATNQPVVRSTGLQRSIASAPGSRASSSNSTATSRATAMSRPATAAARRVVRPATSTRPAATQAVGARAAMQTTNSRASTLLPAQQPSTQKRTVTKLNPKLIDFVDDDLGKQTEAALDRMDADDALESLQLDLGDEEAD